MSKLIATVYKERTLGLGVLPTVALEEQVQAIEEASVLQQQLEGAFSETERAAPMVSALEDLAFIVDHIKEITPKEAAMIQVAGDFAAAGTEVDGGEITPAMESMLGSESVAKTLKSISDFMKKVWEKIQAQFQKFMAWFKEKFFSQEAKTKKAEQEINDSLEAIIKDLKARREAEKATAAAPNAAAAAKPAPPKVKKAESITVPKSKFFNKDMNVVEFLDAYAKEQTAVMGMMTEFNQLYMSSCEYSVKLGKQIELFCSAAISVFQIPTQEVVQITGATVVGTDKDKDYTITFYEKQYSDLGLVMKFSRMDVHTTKLDDRNQALQLLDMISGYAVYPEIHKTEDNEGSGSVEITLESDRIQDIKLKINAVLSASRRNAKEFQDTYKSYLSVVESDHKWMMESVQSLRDQIQKRVDSGKEDSDFVKTCRATAAAFKTLDFAMNDGSIKVGYGYGRLHGKYCAPTYQLARLFAKMNGGHEHHDYAEESFTEMTPLTGSLSMEAFGQTGLTARDVAGKIRDTINSIIAAIKQLIKQVMTYAASYISRITVVAGGSETRLKKLEAAFNQLANKPATNNPKPVSVQLPTVNGNGVSNMSDLIDESRKFADVMKNFMDVAGDANYNYGSGFVRLYESDLARTSDKQDNSAKSRDGAVKLMGYISKAFDSNVLFRGQNHTQLTGTDGGIIAQTPQLIGGVRLVVEHMDPSVFTTTVLHSSTSVRELINRVARKNSISVVNDAVSAAAVVEVEAMTYREIEKAISVVKTLLTFYSARSGTASLSSALQKRTAFAKSCTEGIANAVKKLDTENPVAYAMSLESLVVTDSIVKNASLPYTRLSEAAGRTISYLLTAISKSIAAHAKSHA